MSQKGLTFAAPPCLHLEGNLAENWRMWQQRFQLYLEASELNKKPKKQQKAILLHIIGPDALELFNTFTFSEEEDIDDIRVIMQKFEEHCKPKRNLIYDRHQFLTKQQQEGESFDQFVTELKRLSADCEFRELKDSLIRDRIVCGIRSAQLKERMLRDSDLTLDKAITLGRAEEKAKQQLAEMRETKVEACKTKATHDIAQPQEETSDGDEEFDIGSVTQENKDGSEVYYMANVEGIDFNFKIDTGAQVNIQPYHLMKGMKHKLYQTKAKLKTYTGTAITVKGKTDLAVNGQKHEFFIVEDKHLTPILGYRSAKKLEIIKIMSVTIKEYSTVFGGLGCLKETYKIQIDKEVKPVICPPKKIPVALQQKLKDKLTDMEHKGVIKKVQVPTEWEHDERLRKVLNRCRKINLTLNEKKCHINKEEITYLGHKLTQDGVQPDKEKVKAITAMPPPEDKKGVERLLGTMNYMAKFIPNLSTISEPIRKLLKKDNQFVWEHEQAKAFEEIKNALTSEKTLGYFNPNEKITLECDSSQFGLGAVVTQRGKPIAYASRSLSEAE
ncbi:Pol polyprotein [Plakobranchus ocellatus]|uniref:Pol polyprotein n=1 Tax=Plakobranchus ocellatus TaxID=259542 RepID=A0AAV3XWK7_9GAST|nr:Pol polyprotein [Plakobranchus ocellatus]